MQWGPANIISSIHRSTTSSRIQSIKQRLHNLFMTIPCSPVQWGPAIFISSIHICTGIKQIRRLCSTLRPRSRIQERVLGPLSYLVAYGPGLADTLIDAADPFRIEHGVLEL